MKNIKRHLANIALFSSVLAASLLAAEGLSRWVLNPADYLSVELVQDTVMGAVPSVSTAGGGLDGWGFRNRQVPSNADIVAIGDSHTYGNTATMDDAWPQVLSRLSGRSVYSMALGGYGPNQYFELLNTKALTLRPRTIVVGLYMGDDFENAFLITYGLEHWARLRSLRPEKVDFDIWKIDRPLPTWHKNIRIWLSRHSVIYQLMFHGPLMGRLQGQFQINNARMIDDSATAIAVPERNILEAFRPAPILRNLDQENESIREGMRITFKLIADMDAVSRENHIQFVVAVIPTKELVFAELLEHNADVPLSATIDRLLINERLARDETFKFLRTSNISYVDLLPHLRRSIDQELYAKTAADMHPNRNGYRVIAKAVFDSLQTMK